MDLRKIRCGVQTGFTYLRIKFRNRFVDSVIDPYTTEKTGCFLTSPGTITFSKMSAC